MKRSNPDLIWREVSWIRPFSQSNVLELLMHIAALSPRKQVIWEVRGSGGKVRYFIATKRRYMKSLKSAFSAHGDIEFAHVQERDEVTFAKQLKIPATELSLKTQNTLNVLKTALSALSKTKKDEVLTLQIILGDSFLPYEFSTVIRIGATAETNKKSNGLLLSLMSARQCYGNFVNVSQRKGYPESGVVQQTEYRHTPVL
jgi:hypothetical protein